MIEILNENAKKPYKYKTIWMSEFKSCSLFSKISRHTKTSSVGRGKKSRTYYELYCCFDIETYTSPDTNNGYMYIWQFSIATDIDNMYVIKGRTWEEFSTLLDYLIEGCLLDNNHRLLIFVANLGYEFQFMRKHINVTDYFFKEK